jgi:peptide/nickel transport system permease protein
MTRAADAPTEAAVPGAGFDAGAVASPGWIDADAFASAGPAQVAAARPEGGAGAGRSTASRTWWSARRLPGRGVVGLVLVGLVVAVGLAAPLLTRYSPLYQIPGANLLPPSGAHWLGTDDVNRDVWSRTLYGIRIDLLIITLAVPLGAVLGVFAGLTSILSDRLDQLTQRVFDVVLAFPAPILAIGLVAVIGPGTRSVVLVIAVTELPVFGRLVRGAALRVREMPFVEAARVVGASERWILRRHVLPNVLEPVAVRFALALSVGITVESGMSFLELGVRPPAPSLGSIVAAAIPDLDVNPGMALGPLVAVIALALGFLLIAQSLGARSRAAAGGSSR